MSRGNQAEAPAGLSEAEAAARLAAEGPNELTNDGAKSAFDLVFGILREPMLALLVGAGAVYLLLGDIHDALILMAFAGLTIVIAIVQEGRTERAISALREMAMPGAVVIRDGGRRHIPSAAIVRGDLLVVAEGDRIMADGWILRADGLQTDESLLTGESVAVTKRARMAGDSAEPPIPGGDGLPFAFSGTLVVRGDGLLEVVATGPRSRMGRIGLSLATLDREDARLVAQTRRMVRWFALLGVGVSVLAAVLYGLLRGGWLDAVLAGIALAMSMLPEELPVVLTLFMTIGALRMARARVLARKGAAIESLGAATVLCTDKTGTLTQNRMTIAELRLPDGASFAPGSRASLVVPGAFAELAGLGILACQEQPFDPMENAFHELGERHRGPDLTPWPEQGWKLDRQYGLMPDLMAVSHVWGHDDLGGHVVATKGAPEAIAELCGLGPGQRAAMDAAVAGMAERGLRVLGVAEARWSGEDLPDTPRHFDFTWRGLVGLVDPLRETVPDAIRTLQGAGIRVVMITGDYPVTARAIADAAGIRGGEVMTGTELAALDDAGLATRIGRVSVFARVLPEQKLRIVQALKDGGEIVAMTGDGVNDAPSLKAAHIGIAMGKRGTDVAREASAIVLMDDDFGAIPQAVRLGRRIHDNLRKAVAFIVAVHIPIAGLALAPLLAGWPIILGPLHIALLEMVIDPICALAFEAEPEEEGIMRRRPRDPSAALFPGRLMLWSVLQGVMALVLLLGLAAWAFGHATMPVQQTRSIVFVGLVLAVLALVFSNRSFGLAGFLPGKRHNWILAVIIGAVATAFTLLFGVPAIARLFRFTPLPDAGLVPLFMLVAGLLLLLSLLKLGFRGALAK